MISDHGVFIIRAGCWVLGAGSTLGTGREQFGGVSIWYVHMPVSPATWVICGKGAGAE